MIDRKDDLMMEPSEELNRETLAKMAEAASPVHRRKTGMRRMLTCAALIGAMFMLMGAGYRVFTYLAYVPGQGIVTNELENVYTLSHAVQVGDYYIDAVSMVPVTEGSKQGMWEITVVASGCPDEKLPLMLTAADGTVANLYRTLSMTGADRYKGYMDAAEAGSYTIGWDDVTGIADMKLLSKSVYANYEYPVDQGITAVVFPMAEGSDKLVMDFTLDGVSEDLQYWIKHSQGIWVTPESDDFVLTDTEGNTYALQGGELIRTKTPIPEEEKTQYPYLEYQLETIFCLDRRLEAPVASIHFDTVKLELTQIRDTAEYILTIPAEGETVSMPEETLLLNSHGIRDTLLRIESSPFTNRHTLREYHSFTIYRKEAVCAFSDTVSGFSIDYAVSGAEDSERKQYECMQSGPLVEGLHIGDETPVNWRERNYELYNVFPIAADGSKTVRQGTPPLAYGDRVCLSPHHIRLHIAGSWLIDFTAPAESTK